MSAEADEAQSTIEDGGGGPGAPTPLSVLDVCRMRAEERENADLQIRVSLASQLETSSL